MKRNKVTTISDLLTQDDLKEIITELIRSSVNVETAIVVWIESTGKNNTVKIRTCGFNNFYEVLGLLDTAHDIVMEDKRA
jgi:hypothetical protein